MPHILGDRVSLQFGLIDHVEGAADTPSAAVFGEVLHRAEAADNLGFDRIWFAEHHFGVHHGHLPATPLLAVAAGQRTQQISVGSAIICLNLHHPLAVAEQVATVDSLTDGRASFGFGSGCTLPETAAFGLNLSDEVRRERFAEGLDLMLGLWRGQPCAFEGKYFQLPKVSLCPLPVGDLRPRSWVAANSIDSATIAGDRGLGIVTSRERPLEELREIAAVHRISWTQANRPDAPRVSGGLATYVGIDDSRAEAEGKTIVAPLWKKVATRPEWVGVPAPTSPEDAGRRVGFVYGGPESVAQALIARQQALSLTDMHLELSWRHVQPAISMESLRLLGQEVIPMVRAAVSDHHAL